MNESLFYLENNEYLYVLHLAIIHNDPIKLLGYILKFFRRKECLGGKMWRAKFIRPVCRIGS